MTTPFSQEVWHRAGRRCEYCQRPQEFDPLPFQNDHIIARKQGGETALETLALACFSGTPDILREGVFYQSF